MSEAKIAYASCLVGVDAEPVEVEARIGKGLPAFELVGLPERGVRESRVRVRSAIGAQGWKMPEKQLVVNLAPGDLRKTGTSFDLAIACAVIAAAGGLEQSCLESTLLIGELALSGELRAVRGVLPHLLAARKHGHLRAIVPAGNEREAALVDGLEVFVAKDLSEVVEALSEREVLRRPRASEHRPVEGLLDLVDVRGQLAGRRAIEIAAAGAHHLLMVGPPGAGKTMLAQRMAGILPPPGREEALEIATIASASGHPTPGSIGGISRPFRAPHHTSSAVALIGGGEPIRAGEVSLAHRGVLFLDELPEFRRDAIETLRTTMEHGKVAISRARARVVLPADPLVIAAMNPCPCGYYGDLERLCRCSHKSVEKYAGRVSGPLLDRFDLQLSLARVRTTALRKPRKASEGSAAVRERVLRARSAGAALGQAQKLDALCEQASAPALGTLDRATETLRLSARAYVKALRVARTIAILDGRDTMTKADIHEALHYRLQEPRLARAA